VTRSPLYAHFTDWPAHEWRWPHFTAAEMACKGDGSVMLDFDALDRLEILRNHLRAPFMILSAYRSPEYNARVGGAPLSQHMQGRAFDVNMTGHDPREFVNAARHFGFHGIGQYPEQNFVHIDTRPDPAAWTIPAGSDWPIFEDEAVAELRMVSRRVGGRYVTHPRHDAPT
jgi:zinc D-Ala-D-Ala carboxypeptidase